MAKQDRLFNNSKFEFIGDLSHGNEPMQTKKLSEKSSWYKTRLSVGVKDQANINFLSMEYIHEKDPKTIKVCSKEDTSKMLEIPVGDTTLQSTLDMVADFVKIDIDLETDFEKKSEYVKLFFKINNITRKIDDETATDEDKTKLEEYKKQYDELCTNRVVFCHIKDAIKFINASLPAVKGAKVRVRGDVKGNFYKGKNRLNYVPTSIELVPNDTPNKSSVYVDMFYDKDSIDDDTQEKKVFINGWIGEKVKKQDKLFPIQAVIDYSKIDLENEQHATLLEVLKGTFNIEDKNQVHKMGIELKAINGAEVVEFSEDCLTDQQKMQIQVGLKKLEDFKPRGNTFGDKKTELKVISGDYKNYPNGAKEVFSVDDLNDYLASDDSDVSAKDIKKDTPKEEKVEKKTESTQDLMAQLFG